MEIKTYLEEILYQIKAARNSLFGSDNMFDNHHHFLIHCAVVHKIIFTGLEGKKIGPNEKGKIYKFERSKKLIEYFDNSDFLKNDQVLKFRDHFEHIDNRIDCVVQTGFIKDKNVYSGFGINDNKDESMLRNYNNGNLTFYGEVFDFSKAEKWLTDIENHIINKGMPNRTINNISNNSFHCDYPNKDGTC